MSHILFCKGKVAKQAHVGIPDGLHEEEFGRDGFYGEYAHLYRTSPPVAWSRITGALRPRAFDFNKVSPDVDRDDCAYLHPACLYNDDLRISYPTCATAASYFYRNADGDELLFVHEGEGKFETDFGALSYRAGDYTIIPKGTVYRILPATATRYLCIESREPIRFPDRGLLGQQALYDPAVLRVPELQPQTVPQNNNQEYEIRVKHDGRISSIFYPHYPLNVVGWRGTLTVWQLHVEDIRPVSCDRVHLPPSVHTTFVSKNFIVCTFAPRPLENGDPEALKVPFYHSNIDYDEVIFYHRGNFFSRTGISAGMLTLHPRGIQHGPQPRAIARSRDATATNETAVMVDCRHTLHANSGLEHTELKQYWQSWQQQE
ncbi:MAG: homogentisate 1,2-dioxygenase [Pseudomonadota bacterium]|nr:homogentisate 1,2-dioxygenase [Pseudomonadota bacterium]